MEELLSSLKVIFESLGNIVSYEVFSVEGSPVTLKKLIAGLVLLFLGYLLSGRLSRSFSEKILTRFELDESVRASLQKIVYYTLLVVFTLFTLHFIDIPITVFTVMGGALALGLGFGSQNIVNNFISGIILMIERPINVGDIVDVGGLKWTVEEIGARSTRVKTMDNTHVIVPNSSFLEQNVLNWTLADDVVRSKVVVGMAYGSPLKICEEVLLSSAREQDDVIGYPEPTVIFSDFGDNALIFELYFWSHMRNFMQVQKLSSRIRFRMDELFRERNLCVSFPQRDVHIDSLKPIQVELMK